MSLKIWYLNNISVKKSECFENSWNCYMEMFQMGLITNIYEHWKFWKTAENCWKKVYRFPKPKRGCHFVKTSSHKRLFINYPLFFQNSLPSLRTQHTKMSNTTPKSLKVFLIQISIYCETWWDCNPYVKAKQIKTPSFLMCFLCVCIWWLIFVHRSLSQLAV